MAKFKEWNVCIKFCFKLVKKNTVENFQTLKVAFVKHKMKQLNFWLVFEVQKICDLCWRLPHVKDIG